MEAVVADAIQKVVKKSRKKIAKSKKSNLLGWRG